MKKKDKKITPQTIEAFLEKIAQQEQIKEEQQPSKQATADAILYEQQKKEIQRDITILDGVVSEYLKSFVILGYDLKGNKTSILHVKSQQENDAIMEHLKSTVLNILHNG